MEKPISIRMRIGFAAGLYAFFFAVYSLANRMIPAAGAYDLTTPWDRALAFIPGFIYPFYLLYGMLLIPAFMIQDRQLFRSAALAFAVLIAAAGVLFFIFPVHVPRPVFTAETVSEHLVAAVYAHDRPVCGFPSLHVATALMAAMIMYRVNRRVGLLFYIMFALTALATLFVRQHVIADVAGGVLLAGIVYVGVIPMGLGISGRGSDA